MLLMTEPETRIITSMSPMPYYSLGASTNFAWAQKSSGHNSTSESIAQTASRYYCRFLISCSACQQGLSEQEGTAQRCQTFSSQAGLLELPMFENARAQRICSLWPTRKHRGLSP